MRILIDDEDLRWDKAWGIVTNVFFYTNHTVLPVCFVLLYWNGMSTIFFLGGARKMACSYVGARSAEVRFRFHWCEFG